jgi:hypothetical protein
MSDFWTLTNKDEVMDYLESEFAMTDEGYYVVKQDEAAIADVINKVWKDDIEGYLDNAWREIRTNALEELVTQGYLKEDPDW